MSYVIGDTIILTANIVDMKGNPYDPPEITVSVITLDGTELLSKATPGRESEGSYFYEWEIQGIFKKANLIAVWEWTGPNIKRFKFKVVPRTDY